jgi:hypothetical protein
VDGRLVLLGLVVVIAGATVWDLEPSRPAVEVRAERARERVVDVVLVEVDRTQLCRYRFRERYADSVPSLQFSGGRFARLAYTNDLDIQVHATAGGRGYVQRVTGAGVDAVVERRGTELVRVEVGDRPPPRLDRECPRRVPARGRP